MTCAVEDTKATSPYGMLYRYFMTCAVRKHECTNECARKYVILLISIDISAHREETKIQEIVGLFGDLRNRFTLMRKILWDVINISHAQLNSITESTRNYGMFVNN